MKVAEDSVAHVKSVYDKVKAQVDSAPRDDGTLLEKRKELQREVDVTKRTLAQQVPKNIKHKFLGLNLVFLNVSLLRSPISTFLPWLVWLSKILNCSNFSPKKFTCNLSLTIILLSYNWWYSCRAIWNHMVNQKVLSLTLAGQLKTIFASMHMSLTKNHLLTYIVLLY